MTGDPVKVANQVAIEGNTNLGGFSVSTDGRVAYRVGGAAVRQLTWFDRTGKSMGVAGEPDSNNLQYPELSPDGRRVAMSRTVQGNFDIWLLDLVRGGLTRLTFDAGQDSIPVWSPDGMQIAFSSNRKSTWDLYVKASNGSGTEDNLLEAASAELAQAWSKDGRFLLYSASDSKTGLNLWALDITARDRQSRAVATPRLTRQCRNSLLTDAGSRTRRTSRADSKSSCSPFPTQVANGRCQQAAAPRRAGAPTAGRSTSLRPTRR
jgi:dipeptidyl aminopeptidase/acylaminoacyl peptidase